MAATSPADNDAHPNAIILFTCNPPPGQPQDLPKRSRISRIASISFFLAAQAEQTLCHRAAFRANSMAHTIVSTLAA
jgi:hypothetical protein